MKIFKRIICALLIPIKYISIYITCMILIMLSPILWFIFAITTNWYEGDPDYIFNDFIVNISDYVFMPAEYIINKFDDLFDYLLK